MAAPQGPIPTTMSRYSQKTARGRHMLEIVSPSLQRSLGAGSSIIRSGTFSVGGHDWSIVYYPEGDGADDSKDYASVYIQLVDRTAAAATQVRAVVGFGMLLSPHPIAALMHPQTRGPAIPLPSAVSNRLTGVFASPNSALGCRRFVRKSVLQNPLWMDRLVIECDVTVVMGDPVLESGKRWAAIQVPPSNLSENLGRLLESAEGADVMFMVEGEVFRAHSAVLAIRSVVFRAQLYGPLGESNRDHITIEDMQPAVFRALLHFIYTDSLPAMDDLGGDECEEMVKHLLVAAGRYGVERMQVMCESILARRLDVKSVAATLAFADQYHCWKLKDACIGFINSLNRTEEVQASQGYAQLKRTSPDVIVEIWEKATKSRKI